MTCGGKGRPFKNVMTEGKKLKLALNIFANNNIQGRYPYLNNHKLSVFHVWMGLRLIFHVMKWKKACW